MSLSGHGAARWRLRHNTARPDILAADEAEPIDPLLVGQPDALVADFIPFSVAHLRLTAQAKTDVLAAASLPEIENVRATHESSVAKRPAYRHNRQWKADRASEL
jgi:hypothetical protein